MAYTQPTFTCSKLTIQILEQDVEYVQCYKLNVSVVINFEHVMAGWVLAMWKGSKKLQRWVEIECTLHRSPRSSEIGDCSGTFK